MSPRHIACIGLFVLCACAEKEEQRATVKVDRGDLMFQRTLYGELEARNKISIHVPDISGVHQVTVAEVLEDGTTVKKGQVVLSFDKSTFEDELQDLENALAVAKAEHRRSVDTLKRERVELQLRIERARLNVQRAKLGVQVGVNLISKVELEKAKIAVRKMQLEHRDAKKAVRAFASKRKATLEVKQLKVDAAAEKVKEKREHIAKSAVVAPAGGTLYAPYTRLNWVRGKVSVGSVARPGDKLLELPDLSSFNAQLYVRQRDASLLKVGDVAAVFATVRPDKPLKGKVIKKETFATTRNERTGGEDPAGNLKEVKVTVQLEGVFPELRPGGTVRAEIRTTVAKDVQRVPLAAVREENGHYYVELAGGGRQEVTLGALTTVFAELKKGPAVGTALLLPGSVPAGAKESQPIAKAKR